MHLDCPTVVLSQGLGRKVASVTVWFSFALLKWEVNWEIHLNFKNSSGQS